MSYVLDDDMDLLAAEYVLGTLDGEERARAQSLLIADEDFAAAVIIWERRFGELHLMVEPVDPPPQLWDRISARLAEFPPRPDYDTFEAELEATLPMAPAAAATKTAALEAPAPNPMSAAHEPGPEAIAQAATVTLTAPAATLPAAMTAPPPPSMPMAAAAKPVETVKIAPAPRSGPDAFKVTAEQLKAAAEALKLEAAPKIDVAPPIAQAASPADIVAPKSAGNGAKPPIAPAVPEAETVKADTAVPDPVTAEAAKSAVTDTQAKTAEAPDVAKTEAPVSDHPKTDAGGVDDQKTDAPPLLAEADASKIETAPSTAAADAPTVETPPPRPEVATLSVALEAPAGGAAERGEAGLVIRRLRRWRALALLMTLLTVGLAALAGTWRFFPEYLPSEVRELMMPATFQVVPRRRPAPPDSQFDE